MWHYVRDGITQYHLELYRYYISVITLHYDELSFNVMYKIMQTCAGHAKLVNVWFGGGVMWVVNSHSLAFSLRTQTAQL